MKKLNIFTAFLLVSLVCMPLAIYGCSNSPVTHTYEYNDFTCLDIQNAFNIQVIQSATFGITITSSKALEDYVTVAKTGDTLVLKLQPNHLFTDFVLMRKTLKVKIMMPVLHSIALSGACEGTVKGFKSTESLNLDISGASTMTMDNIETGKAQIAVSGASRLKGKVIATSLDFEVSGASKVELDGESEELQLKASGASKVNMQEFICQTARAELEGASEVTVDVKKQLSGSLSGASCLYFFNNPKVTVEVTGASTLKHK